MKKITVSVTSFLLCVILLLQTGCASGNAISDGEDISTVISSLSADMFGEKDPEAETVKLLLPRHVSYEAIDDKTAYASLSSDEQRQAYESIEASLFSITAVWDEEYGGYRTSRAFIPTLTSAEIFMVKEAVISDHPEVFWIGSKYSIGSNLHDGPYVVMYSVYDYREIITMLGGLKQKLISALGRISGNRSEYERELIIHDILVDSIEYASEEIEAASDFSDASTVYGALVNHRALCGGYSVAFKLLCNRVGISCSTVKGYSGARNESHMWNVVKISGKWYHVDVTWDDPVYNGDDAVKHYDYFNLTDSWIAYDHKTANGYEMLDKIIEQGIEEGYKAFFNFPIPECSSEKHNFYKRNAVGIEALNEENAAYIAEILKECCATGDGDIYLSFPKRMDSDKVTEWLTESFTAGRDAANEYAEQEQLLIIQKCIMGSRPENSATPWSNIYCIRVFFYS